MEDYLAALNDIQRQAVTTIEGPVLVVAGPGSGKTRVLTARIAHMMKQGIDPFNILALTFTNKAAKEMRERVEHVLGHEARNLYIGTFHSVFARILRFEAPRLNYTSNFTIYDTDDTKSLMKSIIKELGLNDAIYKPGVILNRISSAKNALVGYKEYNQDAAIQADDHSSGKPRTGELFEIYAKRCLRAGAMDFDDLLFNMYELLSRFPDELHKYQHRFKYILIDEFQDTNYAQYQIIRKLGAVYENICAVGDDAQSIYSFRGANIKNILDFERDYTDLKVFKLEQNYRSTKYIVDAANKIIINNKKQINKTIWTENERGEKIKLIKALSDAEEGRFIADAIFEEKMNNHRVNNDFTILYRTNSQSRAFEESLRRLNLPYTIYGGVSFYQRKEIKDLLAYMRLTVNNYDEEALKRIINYPARGIGQTTLDKAALIAHEQNTALWNVLENIYQYPVLARAAHSVSDFIAMIKNFDLMSKSLNAYELAKHIAKASRVQSELHNDKTVEGVSRFENLQELLNGIREFALGGEVEDLDEYDFELENETEKSEGTDEEREKPEETDLFSNYDEPGTIFAPISNNITIDSDTGEITNELNIDENDKSLGAYLQQIALLTDADKDNGKGDRIKLMTIHAAKGLEFPVVFVVGLEENLFPSMMALQSRDDLEEERRLFYVAITRAKDRLFLSYATSRFRYGQMVFCDPSRFIDELDPSVVEFAGQLYRPQGISEEKFTPVSKLAKGYTPKIAIAVDPNFIPDDHAKIQVGMEVEHQRFGKGKVTNLEGKTNERTATIFFPGQGQKKIMLKYAKLRIVG